MNKFSKIAERMKNRRIELGLSYHDLAKKTGLSASTLQRYETGFIKNLPIEKFELIATALEIDPLLLMGIDEKSKNKFLNTIDEQFEYDKFMKDATYYFTDESVSDEDKKKLLDSLNNIFFNVILEKKKK